MTSEERKAARRKRREQERAEKREKLNQHKDFGSVFSYDHLYSAYRKCRRGVAWKASTQRYMTQAPLNVWRTWKQLQAGTFASKGFWEFDLHERGKTRHIRSVGIEERVVQRALCDHALAPVLGRSFIHDNSASRTGHGYHFAVRRLCQHLWEHFRQYGQEGYILLYDFSKFFDTVPHALCKNILEKHFQDERMLKLCGNFIDAFGEKGLGLGSQISQTLALASADRLDHYIKEVLRIRGYGRYMDDGYLIHQSKGYLKKCMSEIRRICAGLGITLNERKTQIVKLSHGFTWLKVRFYVAKTGRVIRMMHRSSITRVRRKLKKYAQLVKNGKMSFESAYAGWQSWKAYAAHFSACRTVRNTARLFDRLFVYESW